MKTLPLNQNVLQQHQQKFQKSCVAMSVEFIVKLVDPLQINYEEQQKKFGNVAIGSGEFDNLTINNIKFSHLFNIKRFSYELTPLFDKIKEELDNDRYVQLALEEGKKYDQLGNVTYTNYHAWVVYGYNDSGEFLGVTKNPGDSQPKFIDNIRKQITDMGGTDILVYR